MTDAPTSRAKAWTAEAWLDATPTRVLALLTEPDAIARWAPIPFDVLDLDGDSLQEGSQARVSGALAGRRVEFDVEITEANDRCLSLVADGPISISASYLLAPREGGTDMRASVAVSGRGFIGGALARLTETLLAAGALRASLARIAGEPALAA